MEEEFSVEYDGLIYTATYCVFADELIVYLPDGSQRKSFLSGLEPESAAQVHLRSYARDLQRKKPLERG
ncbi:TPA: hypothetical protein L6B33_24235 [Pseudomonas aeruginosa]|nr:hypothetical protein [Pseudomonas aeruginosa]